MKTFKVLEDVRPKEVQVAHPLSDKQKEIKIINNIATISEEVVTVAQLEWDKNEHIRLIGEHNKEITKIDELLAEIKENTNIAHGT